jgi:hypothetical protein
MRKSAFALFLALGIASIPAQADTAGAEKLAAKYLAIAKTVNPALTGLSAEAGHSFYIKKFTVAGKDIFCDSCHTANPAAVGKDTKTKKAIPALAPAVNSKRFTSLDKVEKNFEKHCIDIIGRDCMADEKGNFIAYLLTIKAAK